MFPIPINKVSEIANLKLEEFQKYFSENLKDKLRKNIDYFSENKNITFSKRGFTRLTFISQNEKLSLFLDNLEDSQNELNVKDIYKNIEYNLIQIADDFSKNGEKDLEKIEKFVNIFEKFLKIKGNMQNIFSETEKHSYNFASKTEDDAFKFATNMGKDAYNFTSGTRDKAHDFVMKTEDDAFHFATNMGKDAYNFASKGMDYGYHFASRGMKYGYEFASKGEEVGEMANRVLWMASEIGIMADRIGEMSDRIVHTEHIIIQTAMLIQNFGLLIDGTVKHLSESIIYSLSLVLDKEFKPLETTNKHLEIIESITKEILNNNHEYDIAVLQNQVELRKITISALDKIDKNF